MASSGWSASAVPAMVLDPERALWVPGQKTIVDLGAGRDLTPITLSEWTEIPIDLDAEDFNALVTPDWVIKNVMASLERSLRFGANINRSYDEQYQQVYASGEAAVRIMTPRVTLLDAG